MIDTIKIFSMIPSKTFEHIKENSDIKTSYNNKTGQTHYKIINGHLQGNFNSNLCIRIGEGKKYGFINNYFIEIEGSYHKMIKGYNSHNGFCHLHFICNELIKMVENNYNIKLPSLKHWFLQRVDIAICYDLKNQDNVKSYINNLSCCNYPRRNLKHYEGESIYITGFTTTLKIYNKQREFLKNDKSRFLETDFNITKYLNKIQGFIRFECEIKKRKLKQYFHTNYIRVERICYEFLKEIWLQDFQKFFKAIDNELTIVKNKEDVKNRLNSLYKPIRAKNLFNFYLLLLIQGIQEIKQTTKKSMFYKNIADLKKANVDFSQKLDIDMTDNRIQFNPFEWIEID